MPGSIGGDATVNDLELGKLAHFSSTDPDLADTANAVLLCHRWYLQEKTVSSDKLSLDDKFRFSARIVTFQ